MFLIFFWGKEGDRVGGEHAHEHRDFSFLQCTPRILQTAGAEPGQELETRNLVCTLRCTWSWVSTSGTLCEMRVPQAASQLLHQTPTPPAYFLSLCLSCCIFSIFFRCIPQVMDSPFGCVWAAAFYFECCFNFWHYFFFLEILLRCFSYLPFSFSSSPGLLYMFCLMILFCFPSPLG